MFTNRMKFTFPILTALLVLSSCSGLKTVSQAGNYDDAYFTASDLKGRGFYAEGVATGEFNPASPQRSGSYGQTYADRMRHFGGNTLQPAHRPVAMMQPCNGFRVGMSPMFGMGFNPYMGYNPMMMGNPWMMGNSWGNPMMMGNPWNNPWMMGSMSWNTFNDPYWMYYNQMFNPNMYWGGGSFGGWNNNGWNNGSGNSWSGGNNSSGGFVNNPKQSSGSSGFTNSGVRRNSYQSGMPASTSGRTSSWSSGSTAPSGNINSNPSSRSSNWTPSGNTQQGSFNGGGRSSNAVQGTSGRRR
jgi:hypothetical protein